MKKKYLINEIFYSVQGEGRWTGRPAIFIRFSGCNLRCPFCDTDFSKKTPMSIDEILAKIAEWEQCRFIVLTGGEPTLQVDNDFVEIMHGYGYTVAIETNGTREVPSNIDWITVSPKAAYVENGKVWVTYADEVKVVYDGVHEVSDFNIQTNYLYVQPCDTGDPVRNQEIIRKTVEFIKKNPQWSLSLQTQKILNVR